MKHGIILLKRVKRNNHEDHAQGIHKERGVAALGTVAGGPPAESRASLPLPDDRLKGAVSTTSVCPYCAVGCGLIVKALAGKVVRVGGDPEHPINQGTLCSKGTALLQTVNSPGRLKKVLYRGPGQDHWEEKSWEWALPRIARRIKANPGCHLCTGKRRGYGKPNGRNRLPGGSIPGQ